MNGLNSFAITSCTNDSIAVNPFGDKSVLDDKFNKKDITVSPKLIYVIECIRSLFGGISLLFLISSKYFIISFYNRENGAS